MKSLFGDPSGRSDTPEAIRFDPRALEQLRLVTCSDPDVDASCFPAFFIAGPQRTGSTWLYGKLSRHPQVAMSRPKEVYFFNTLANPGHEQHWSTDVVDYLQKFEVDKAYRKERKRQCRRDFKVAFEPKIFGEATASYAAAMNDPDMVRDAVLLNPDLKVLICARHPVDRMWSHAKLDLARHQGRKIADVPHEEIERFITDPYHVRCGHYTWMHEYWNGLLKPGNLLITCFDHVVERPQQLCQQVFEFLEIDTQFDSAANPGDVNTSEPVPIAEPYRSQLLELYRQEIEIGRDFFGVDWYLD